jgi:CDGSH-type Zn-finger protein
MSADKKPTITPKPDGPYLVRDLETLRNSKGAIDTKASFALCRCGGSSNKPFCDGTHARNGFSSAKHADRVADKRDTYEGAAITVHDNRGQCAHAGFCTGGSPGAFRLKQEPFVDPDGAPADEIAATIGRCPSGALRYSRNGQEHGDRGGDPAVVASANGPYLVSGGCELADTSFGEGVSADHYALCRCGGSKNKPFCDGTHWHKGFKAD